VAALLRQIRSRYKALCACLGVRPRLLLASAASPSPALDGSSTEAEPGLQVDDDDDDDGASRAGSSTATTTIGQDDGRVAGSAIPVWKVDGRSGLKSAVTNVDLSF